jgi:hypothetical protein
MEQRTRVDPEGLADNDIHRLVRVTAFRLLVYLRPPGRWQPQQSQVHYGRDGPGFRSDPNLHRAQKRPIQSADRSTERWVASARVSCGTWWEADQRGSVTETNQDDA